MLDVPRNGQFETSTSRLHRLQVKCPALPPVWKSNVRYLTLKWSIDLNALATQLAQQCQKIEQLPSQKSPYSEPIIQD
jgi:hypothetical protein